MTLSPAKPHRPTQSAEKVSGCLTRPSTADRKALLRERFIEEIANYIVKHGGPDPAGRAHPSVKKIKVELLEVALERARARGLSPEWRPYHFSGHSGTYCRQNYVDEVLAKKIDSLLKEPRFNGDLVKLASEMSWDDVVAPLLERVGERTIEISMGQVCNKFGSSPLPMLKRYAEIKGTKILAEFRPYHMRRATSGTYDDPAMVEEVLVKKIDSLLKEHRFDGDLVKLATDIALDDLFAPLLDRVGERTIEVSMLAVGTKFANSPFAMIKRYAEIKGSKELDELRPYHMQKAARGFYNDPAMVNEVLAKKVDSLLKEPRFNGDLVKLATEITQQDLLAPLLDRVGERTIEVSMKRVGTKFADSPFTMVKRYAEIKGTTELDELRPYHMRKAASGFYNDPAMVDEVLVKRIDSLLKQSRFNGDLVKLATEITLHDLLAPLLDRVGERTVEVSMGSVGLKFANSPFAIVKRYAEIKGSKELDELRPYHMQVATSGTYDDAAIVDEVLTKKIASLLRDSRFNGDLVKLATEITQDELLAPIQDRVGERTIEVSMSRVGTKFAGSPFAMVKRYAKIKGIAFPYSQACFEGPPETRARRMRGDFNSYDRRLMKTPAGDYDTRKFGMRVFNSAEKTVVREMIVEAAHGILGDRSTNYLGLEDQHLSSLRLVREYLNLRPSTSVVVERDERVFAAMNSLRKHLPNGEGKDLAQVLLKKDSIEDAVRNLPGPFNLVNLDYVGHLAQSTIDTIQTLIDGRLEDRAIIAVTLQDTPLAKERTRTAGLGTDGARELHRIMKEIANPHYDVASYGEVNYAGGTGSKATPMVVLVFDLKRIPKKVGAQWAS